MINTGHTARRIAGSAIATRVVRRLATALAIASAATVAGWAVVPGIATADERLSPVLRQALERALSVPGARVDSASEERGVSRAADCRATEAEVPRPVDGSGRVAVKLSGRSAQGQRCDAWTWVRVRVVAPVAVATRALRAGEALDKLVVTEERELRAGHAPAQIGPASVAARTIAAGQLIEASEVSEPTLRSGEAVKVLVVSGGLVIEQSGRAVPCVRGRSCAILSTGKHVEGDLVDGRLVVQSP